MRIAEAYRDLKPALILVDDAHLEPEKLERLLWIRTELDADFEIGASAWPEAEDDVADALGGIGSGNIRPPLELLTRAEIVQVLRSIGVSAPNSDPDLRHLVDQSANRPGLAVTLGSLWLRGEEIDVLTGKALRRSLIPALKQVLEHDPTQLLACFALGGNLGLSLEAVGEFLELRRGEIHRQVAQASEGGVLSIQWDLLSVQPAALRSALLEEVLFTPPCLGYRPLLDRAADRGAAIETLAVAAWQGANVPQDDLRELLLEGGSPRAWQAFACLGEPEGQWVLEHFPGSTATIARQLLGSATRPMIRRLLHEAEHADGALHSHPTHSLRLLQDWVQGIPDPYELGEMLRRELLVKEARKYLRDGGNHTVGLRACFLALSPRLESNRWTATGDAVELRQGSLPTSSVPRVLELWADLREDLGGLTPESWSELEQTLQSWVRPNFRNPTAEETASYHEVARQILTDLADRAQERPGLLSTLMRWADRIELVFDGPEDEEFAVLFPRAEHESPKNWRAEEETQRQAAIELAARWASRPPQEAGKRLARYAAEARGFLQLDSCAAWAFFDALAGAVAAPEQWLNAFLKERLPAPWLGPILEQVVLQRREGWKQILEECLEGDDYSNLAGDLVLRCEKAPRELIEAALAKLPADSVETACLRRRVPLATLRFLLEHQCEEVAGAAAVGEWLSQPRGEVRKQVRAEWRRAVLRLGSAGRVDRSPRRQKFGLEEILSSEPDLAAAWLEARVGSAGDNEPVEGDGVFAAAIRPLPNDRRKEFLRRLPASGFSARLITLLIGESAQLYRCFLAQDRLRQHHLTPLAGRPPDASWAKLAKLALESGHEPRAIAEVAFQRTGARRHFGIEHWMKWQAAFRELLEGAPEKLLEVARCGLEIAESKLSVAGAWKRRAELTGDVLGAIVP